MAQMIALQPANVWRDFPRESLAMAVAAVAGLAGLAGAAYSTPTLSPVSIDPTPTAAATPAAPPLVIRAIAPADALALNRSMPMATGPNPPAKPFSMQGTGSEARARALECLTSAVYYEAGSEDADGQRAVAQVVLNRVRHPAFPSTVCGVVYEGSTRATGCQFTFTCDGSLARGPSSAGWARARKVAEAALAGSVYASVGTATHYHADYVVPYWAPTLAKNAVVGSHIFYRWAGGWGRPAAFVQRYARSEPDAKALRLAALAADAASATKEEVAEIPGAEVLSGSAAKGDRLSVRFKMAARKAVEAAPREPYVEKMAASSNLRWTLNGGAPEEQKPLGAPAPTGAATAKPADAPGAL